MQQGSLVRDRKPRWLIAACVLSLCVLASTLASAQEDKGTLAEDRASRTIFDTTPPEPGTLTAPELLKAGPIPVSFSGTQDDGAGIKRVTLWVRHGEDHPWHATNLSSEASEGSFQYTEALGDGTYEFALVAEDNAGNVSPEPEGPGLASTVLDSTPPVITLNSAGASVNIVIEAGTQFTDPGATAVDNIDGDISDRIVVGGSVNAGVPGSYTLTYDVTDTAGNAAERRQRRVEVLPSSSYLLTIVSPQTGAIQALPAPDNNGAYPAGTLVTLLYHAPSGSDVTVQSWQGAQPDPSDPKVASVVMNQTRTVSVSLMQQAGTVQVAVTPSSASWVVTDSTNNTHPGTGSQQLANIPPGEVGIVFNDLEGFETPAPQTGVLTLGETVTFSADYEAMGAYIVSAASGLRARPGESVVIPINLSNRSGLSAYSVTLTYDASAFAFETLSAGALVSAWGAPTGGPTAGSVSISGNGPALTGEGGGTLASITLRVREDADDGESALRISTATLNQGGLPTQAIDGSVLIESDSWRWGDVDGNDRADGVDANLILRYTVGLTQTLPMQDAAGDSSFVGPANVKGAEPPSITIQDAFLIYSFVRGRIAAFPADTNRDGYGPEIPPKVEVELPADITATKGEQRIVRTLGGVVAEPGVDVRVPISIDSATGVFGYLFELQYDSDLLEFRNISKGPLAEPWIEPVFLADNGLLRWTATGADRLSGAGQLCVVTFRGRSNIAPSSSAALTLTRAELNDKLINTSVEADTSAPVLESVSPVQGAIDGYGAITLHGANLANVDTVLLGNTPATHVWYNPRTANLRVITPPHAPGMVNVTVSTLGQESTLENAFEFYEPEVHVALEPESSVYVGDFFQIPVVVTNRAQGVSRISFVLNFDADTFARSTTDAVVLGADGAGATVTDITSIGAGRLRITLEGAIGSGHLCTINLVVMSASVDPDTLVYVTDGQADAAGASKAVSGGSALPSRGRW